MFQFNPIQLVKGDEIVVACDRHNNENRNSPARNVKNFKTTGDNFQIYPTLVSTTIFSQNTR